MPRPPAELRRLRAVVFVQVPLHHLEGLGHVRDVLELVGRVALPLFAEELRPHTLQLLVHPVNVRPALGADIQPPEVALSEVVEIRNVRAVLR